MFASIVIGTSCLALMVSGQCVPNIGTRVNYCCHKQLRLIKNTTIALNIFCSPQKTYGRFPLHRSTLPYFKNVIGLYRLNDRESHICYLQKVSGDLIDANTMTGGEFYSIGN